MITPRATPFLAGFSTGLRAFTPLALISWSHVARPAWLQRPIAKGIVTAAAAGELTYDKLPFALPRTQGASLATRLVLGGAAGFLLTRRRLSGALFGILGALAGTFGGYHARRALTKGGKRPDWPTALVEDATAMALVGVAASQASVTSV